MSDSDIESLVELLNNDVFLDRFLGAEIGDLNNPIVPQLPDNIGNFDNLSKVYMKRAKSLSQGQYSTCVTFAVSLSLCDSYYNIINSEPYSNTDTTYEYSQSVSPYGTVNYYNKDICTGFINGVFANNFDDYNTISAGCPFIPIIPGGNIKEKYETAIIPANTTLIRGKVGIIGTGELIKGSLGYIEKNLQLGEIKLTHPEYLDLILDRINYIKYCLANKIGVSCQYECPTENLPPGQVIDFGVEYMNGRHENSIIGIDGQYIVTRNSWGFDQKPLKFIWYNNWGNILRFLKFVRYEQSFQNSQQVNYSPSCFTTKNKLQIFIEKIQEIIQKILNTLNIN